MYVPRSEKSQTITRVTISRRPSPITRSHRLLCMCVCMRVYVYTYPPRVSRSIYECTWEVYREILPWITTYARYEIRQTYLEDSSQETTRWPDTIKALPTRRDPPTKRDAHRCSHSYCIYIYSMYYTRDDLRYYWRITDGAFLSLYMTHAREKGKMRKRGITSSPSSLFFPWSIDSQKMPVWPSLSFHRFFPFTSPSSSFSSFPLSLSDVSLSFSGSVFLFERLSLFLSPSFSFSRSIGSREQAGMPPQEYEKCNKKGENCRWAAAPIEWREEGVPRCRGAREERERERCEPADILSFFSLSLVTFRPISNF